MDNTHLIEILVGGNLLMFIKFLIERHDKKKSGGAEKIKDTLVKLEKDGLRTQLLLLLLMKPQERQEILTIGEHYFKDLKGNWYMTSMFKKWCDENGLEPEWFEG